MSYDIVVFGSLHMDIMVWAQDRPRRGETLTGASWRLKHGGKGGNQAVEASLAGARTAMISAVGDDDFGRSLLQNLRDKGVDTSHVFIRAGAESGMSVAIVDAGGDYGAVIVSGVNLQLGAAEVDAAAGILKDARILLLQNEIPDAANLAAVAAARGKVTRTILNAAPARAFPYPKSAIDVLVVNAIEAEALGSNPVSTLETAQTAADFLVNLARAVVVTAGGAGLALSERHGDRATVAGHAVDLVSTHGAGDCFIGWLAARLAAGETLADAAQFANAAAAVLVSTPPGATRENARIDALLRSR
jgi:ribokinase